MKDALVRDRLSKEKGILCFEMEAAGLMNHFRCLVIRGICNYSDSHTNKDWQGYAAMTAAAYTKDLLCQIQPSDLAAEERLNGFVVILESAPRTEENIDALKFKAAGKKISKSWAGSRQPTMVLNRMIFKRAQLGTGQWLLQFIQYWGWLSTKAKTLFCLGMFGTGKTILASIIIYDLWSSVLKQLAGRLVPLPEQVRRLYHNHRVVRTRPSSKDLSDALYFTLGQYYGTYIVIDALGQCDASTGCRDRFLSEIFRAQSGGKVSILVTPRNNPEIQNKFTECAILEIRANSNDVEKYVDNHISELPAFIRDNSSLQQDIKASINRTADGMFLLAQLYLDSLKGKLTLRAVRKALEDFVAGPDAYEHAYSSAMERINGQPREEADLARRILSWIAFARRPLVTEELRHALSVEAGMSHLGEDDLLQVDMASMCAGLVTIDKESDIIRLVHYTTQQYFEKSFQRWFGNPHVDITETCLTYLSFQSFGSGFARCYLEYEARLKSNPFYLYASCNWGYHAHLAPTCQDVLPFLQRQSHVEATSQALIKSTLKNASVGKATIPGINGLHLADYFDLEQVRDFVWLYDVDKRDGYNQTPLLLYQQ
ncbi:hypothetical protein ANO14919_117260 [Xylariales sp. No.14919]|nr:hypothetical protein ANO14919_117260 [Xylariales sp. No.14919]